MLDLINNCSEFSKVGAGMKDAQLAQLELSNETIKSEFDISKMKFAATLFPVTRIS